MTDISHLSGALQEEKAKARVLLVDDQKIIAEAMKRLLADQPDISLYYCPNPSKAIDAAKEVKPTVILQDLIMPENFSEPAPTRATFPSSFYPRRRSPT